MNQAEAEALIASEIRLERPDVVAAKGYVLQCGSGKTREVAEQWGREVAGEPSRVLRLDEADFATVARQYARFVSAQLAMFQAVSELIGAVVLLPAGSLSRSEFKIEWETGGGRYRSSFDFKEFGVPYFDGFDRPRVASNTILTDGDLYLASMSSSGLHPGVEHALRMAVACFRRELFVPSVVMLGAASEGAWIELGRALVALHPNEGPCKKVAGILDADVTSMRGIIRDITETLYVRQDLFSACAQASGVKLHRLREIAIWSHTVREARNVLHWRAGPSSSNTYEGVAVLLMSALQNVGDLEKLRGAAATP